MFTRRTRWRSVFGFYYIGLAEAGDLDNYTDPSLESSNANRCLSKGLQYKCETRTQLVSRPGRKTKHYLEGMHEDRAPNVVNYGKPARLWYSPAAYLPNRINDLELSRVPHSRLIIQSSMATKAF